MIEAKEGERTCLDCGTPFRPQVPEVGDERDERCQMCEAMRLAPAWYFGDIERGTA